MLFMTVNPIGSLNANKAYYAQSGLNKPFWVSASISSIAYNNNNPNGITYIDGVLNESVKSKTADREYLKESSRTTVTGNRAVVAHPAESDEAVDLNKILSLAGLRK